MKSWERKIAPVGFLLAGVLFVIAAVIPLLKGKSLNAAFIGVGAMFVVLGAVALNKSNGPNPPAS